MPFQDYAGTDVDEEEQQNVDEPGQFIIDQVFNYLKETPLPETWCWVTNPKEETSIILSQMNRYTLTIRLHLVLYNDLSVTVRSCCWLNNIPQYSYWTWVCYHKIVCLFYLVFLLFYLLIFFPTVLRTLLDLLEFVLFGLLNTIRLCRRKWLIM